MNFPEVWLGHEKIIQMLKTAMGQKRLAHGYIFDGPEGIGKKSIALWTVASLLCQGDQKPCRVCPSCIKFLSDNHPDVLVVAPEESSIKNHQIEELQSFLSVKPFLGEVKAVIMDSAETMTVSAQNRLLKILEEPPKGTYIILIATNSNRLLSTVLSRSQTLRFQSLSQSGIASYLANHYNVDRAHSEHIAALSNGSLSKALELANSNDLSDVDQFVQELFVAFESKNLLKPFDLVDQYEKRIDWEQALEWLVIELQQRINRYARQKDTDSVYQLVSWGPVLENALRGLREQANERIVIDMMLLKMQEVYYG